MQSAAKKRAARARRARASSARVVRANVTVSSAVRRIQKDLSLPEGSVKIFLPTGRCARGDKKIGKLRQEWSD